MSAEVLDAVVPLIFTSEGNVPESGLTYKYEWSEDDASIYFKEFWFNKEETLVKNSVHVYVKRGLDTTGEQYIG